MVVRTLQEQDRERGDECFISYAHTPFFSGTAEAEDEGGKGLTSNIFLQKSQIVQPTLGTSTSSIYLLRNGSMYKSKASTQFK